MTTIAWDGITLASDSRMTCDSHITTDNCTKIFKLDNIKYLEDELLCIGFAGRAAHFGLYLSYLRSEKFPGSVDHEVHAILVGSKYLYEAEPNEGFLVQYQKKTKLTLGSGGVFALSAMNLGLSAEDSVRHAIKLDSGSGGKVQFLRPS